MRRDWLVIILPLLFPSNKVIFPYQVNYHPWFLDINVDRIPWEAYRFPGHTFRYADSVHGLEKCIYQALQVFLTQNGRGMVCILRTD